MKASTGIEDGVRRVEDALRGLKDEFDECSVTNYLRSVISAPKEFLIILRTKNTDTITND